MKNLPDPATGIPFSSGRLPKRLLHGILGGWIVLSFYCSPKIPRSAAGKPPTEDLSDKAFLKKNLSSVLSIDPMDTSYEDLSALKTAIGEARIVMLGEQTHGEGSTFLAKTRIIQFLHEQMGFSVLAFESGFYDCGRIWENTRNGGDFSKEAQGSLFYMYATSKQMAPLFRYIQSKVTQPDSLVITGFESQHTGRKSQENMFPDFETFWKERNPAMLDSDWEIFKRVSLAMFASRAYRPDEGEKKIFFRKLAALQKKLSDLSSQPSVSSSSPSLSSPSVSASASSSAGQGFLSPGFWDRVARSIESQALRYWEMVSGNEVSVRDLQMADNLIWLAEKAFPGKKIIVWAHNGHIARNTQRAQPLNPGPGAGFLASFVPMGTTVHAHFGNQVYSIGFSGAEGTYMDYADGRILTLPLRWDQGLEGQIANAGYSYAFLDYRHAGEWGRRERWARLSDFTDMRAVWPEVFDGLFFIRRVFPVNR